MLYNTATMEQVLVLGKERCVIQYCYDGTGASVGERVMCYPILLRWNRC